MRDQAIEHRLAAILVADVAGYTRLMEADEAGVYARWRETRDEIIEPTITARWGRVVKFTGDGVLAEFLTAQSAVACALEIQELLRRPNALQMQLRVRYVLEGSVRKAGQRIRVTAQLIDAAGGGHLWAERFELTTYFSRAANSPGS